MKCYDGDRNINNLISETLTNQTVEVVVDGESSEPASVDSGVPQGMVQGPILYMCHINDLPDYVNQQSDYLQTTASCTAVSGLQGTIPYLKTTSTNLRSGLQNGVCSSTPKQMLCYEHKPEISLTTK